ncbi:MAG: Stk1 family PASTA domain-containing Ser/Thr kinase, partial [Oscillospiraceae bacterium]|nr:Stk1 family PASTA domain-containing Ser/Thr kinase [Oscillospiraceae bacterium]
MDQYIGKMLDNRYEILEVIGRGGMAVVYKAKCHRLNRLVAVKILKSDLAQDDDFRRRFHDESQAVAMLTHPNIVSVYDVSKNGDEEYIVMELIDGITLKQYMAKRGQLNWRESLHFITQIMKGLSHAHSRGIIHRDIKPQNIMILRDGSVKVTDFGIACLSNSANTLTQEALGSVHYISPEQARGERSDARSDIYSAGVVLYEMLTSRLPFEGDSAVSVAIQHLSSIPLSPRDINRDVPEALELICMRAMCSDINRRYASAGEMLGDLEEFRKDPNVNLPINLKELHGEETVEEPTAPIKAGAAAGAALGGQKEHVREYNGGKKTSRPVRDPYDYEEEESSSGWKKGLMIGGIVLAAIAIAVLLWKLVLGTFGGPVDSSVYTVPDVLGYTVEEALQLEEVKDVWEIEVLGSRVRDDYEVGEIVEQDPVGGRTKKTDLVIQVYICAAEEVSYMPSLENVERQNAEIQLRNLHLDLDIKYQDEEFHDEIEEGHVISTLPTAGTELHKGDTVYLTVSKGPEIKPVAVPTLVGMQLEQAKKLLTELGLDWGEITPVKNGMPEGVVIWQSVEPPEEVDEGTKID